MTSRVKCLPRYFRSAEPSHTIMVSGLGNGDNETLPRALRLNPEGVIYTIPTIAIVVQSFTLSAPNGHKFKVFGWDGGAGCAGFRWIVNLLRWYIVNEEADVLVWVVDSSERERLEESVDSLHRILNPPEVVVADHGKKVDIFKTITVLLLANYGDRPGALSVDEIRDKFTEVTHGHTTAIYGVTITSGVPSGLDEAFSWLANTFDNTSAVNSNSIPKSEVKPPYGEVADALPDPRSPTVLAEKLELWIQRAESDSSPDDFLAQFEAVNLPSWDHYTHLRLAYVILTAHGRQKGKDLIFDGIAKYIANSKQTAGRSFHFTMTYFWVQIVHFGIQNMVLLAAKREETEQQTLSPENFAEYLSTNPYVADGNLWADYYSTSLLMSSEAKAQMVLPDRKPLPSIAGKDNT